MSVWGDPQEKTSLTTFPASYPMLTSRWASGVQGASSPAVLDAPSPSSTTNRLATSTRPHKLVSTKPSGYSLDIVY
ncbi:MAG: hypothetical protein GY925_11700 [Actinomycetia bacterium]|nr:hypothetical protein [Actinomycetes bacterium]